MRRFILMVTMIIAVDVALSRTCNAEIYTTVSGRVTAEDTGKGIAGVTVGIRGRRGDQRVVARIETNEEGRYVIKDVLSGIYNIYFIPQENSPYVERMYRKIEVPTGKHLTNVNQVLKLGGSISGTVYDNDGKTPVADIRMFGECRGATDDEVVHRFVRTDSNGYFAMNGFMESDKCTVKISESQRFNISRDVSVKKEQTTVVDFSLADRTTGISGFVTFSDNSIPSIATIVLRKSGIYSHTYTDKYGRYFIVGVPPGTYEVNLYLFSGKTPIKQTTTVVIENGKTTELNFVIPIPGKQSNNGFLKRLLSFLMPNKAYAQVIGNDNDAPIEIDQSCVYTNDIFLVFDDVLGRIVMATPTEMGPAIKVRVAARLKKGIKVR